MTVKIGKVDPFTYEIIKNGLRTASEEMFYAFGRAARSPVIYETLDYASAITDQTGDLVSQANGVPGFLGVLDYAVKDLLHHKRVIEGDAFIANVPYEGGTHLNDVTIIMPIFYNDNLDLFLVNKGHWSEVGGMRFGSWSPDATEIYQEGLQLPNIRLMENDEINTEIIEIIKANSRTPELTIGDMEAQIASMRLAKKRVFEMYNKYQRETVLSTVKAIKEHGKKKAYELLSRLPKGEFKIEDYIDDDGIHDTPIKVQVKLHIDNTQFLADFSGSSKAVVGSINCPFPATVAAVRMVFVAATDPHIDPNGGLFDPIQVIAPAGSIFNPLKPTPTSTYWESMSYASDMLWHIFAKLMPEKFSAGHFLTVAATIVGGINDLKTPPEPFAIVEPQAGGWGALNNADGESALVCSGDGETYVASVEVVERTLPIAVEQFALNVMDGVSKGKYRGGFGLIKDYRILCSEASFSASFGRSKFRPWGMDGGEEGTSNYFLISGSVTMRGRRVGGIHLKKGDLISLRTATGGAWGDYKQRAPEKVKEDLKNGYISEETAKKWYL